MMSEQQYLFLLSELKHINERLEHMAATLTDLDSAIAAVKAQVDAITPPAPPAPTDFTPEVTAVQAIGTELATKFPAAAPTPTGP